MKDFYISSFFTNSGEVDEMIKFCNESFEKPYYKVNKFLKMKLNSFSTPKPEFGARELVANVFDQYKNFKISEEGVKRNEVVNKDIEEVNVYCRKKPFKIEDVHSFERMIEFMTNNFYMKPSENLSVLDCIDALPSGTSSCFPDFNKKGTNKSIKIHLSFVRNVLMRGEDYRGIFNYLLNFPTVIFHRFTPKFKGEDKSNRGWIKPNWKIRQIFGVPYFIIILEKLVMNDVMNSFKHSFRDYYTVGLRKSEVGEKVSKLRNEAIKSNSFILCGDIGGCDKSITSQHCHIFFSFFSKFISKEHKAIYIALSKYFNRNPILYHSGTEVSNGSTVTGSYITSMFTTFCVFTTLVYSYIRLYERFPKPGQILVQGDDFLMVVEDKDDVFFIKEFLMEFNMRLRIDAQKVVFPDEDVEFLGFFWDRFNLPDQTDEWIISRVLFPERFVKFPGPFRIISRLLSILIQLKRFRFLFFRFCEHDYYLRRHIRNKDRPKIPIIDNNGKISDVSIPLIEMLRVGWRLL